MKFTPRLVATALVFAALAAFTRAGTTVHEYPWAGCATVALDLPANWSEVHKQYGEKALTFILAPKSGASAEMTLSFFQHRKTNADQNSALTGQLEKAVAPFLDRSTEKIVTPEPLKMRQGNGLMVQLTGDGLVGISAPLALKHKVVRVATCILDNNCSVFAVMQFDAPGSAEGADMLAMLTNLSFQRTSPVPFLEITPEGDTLVLSAPVSKLRLTIPHGGWVDETDRSPAVKTSPRYFYLVDASRHLFVSGWFEAAKGYSGIKDFWKSENAGDRLGAKKVVFDKAGPWDVVFYDVPVPELIVTAKGESGLTSTHLRAELARADTWIDLHCSITADSSSKESRAALRTFLESLKIDEK